MNGFRGQMYPCPNAFVTKLSPSGNVVWSTYLGGSGPDDAHAIAVESSAKRCGLAKHSRTNRILVNISSRRDMSSFYRVSSGKLGMEYLQSERRHRVVFPALIDHTDCNSIVSAAILEAWVPASSWILGRVIASDHGGGGRPLRICTALDPARNIDLRCRT